jgi:hypothetical protein
VIAAGIAYDGLWLQKLIRETGSRKMIRRNPAEIEFVVSDAENLEVAGYIQGLSCATILENL